MLLKVLTPERVIWRGEIDSVKLPLSEGEAVVLPDHTDLVAVMDAGEILARSNGVETGLFVGQGCVMVQGDEVVALTDEALEARDVDEAKVVEAREEARRVMEEKGDDMEFIYYEAMLKRELAKEKLMEKYK